MPCIRIATGAWIYGRKMDLIEAVQAALVATFQILEWDRDVVLDVYDARRRIVTVRALYAD